MAKSLAVNTERSTNKIIQKEFDCMLVIFQLILTSISGVIIGGLSYGLVFSLIVLILNKVDKSGGWIGVIQIPVLLSFISGIVVGGFFGLFIGVIIGGFKITELLKGAIVSFFVTECLIIIGLVAFSLVDSGNFGNLNRLLDSIISIVFSFLTLSAFVIFPSLIIGAFTVKSNNFISSILNTQNQ